VRLTARQAFQRAGITIRQLEAMRGMVNRTTWALDNPSIDPRAPRDSSEDS
jgi:hypothetical protein